MDHKRLKTAGIVIPVLLAYIYLLPPFPFFLALLFAAAVIAMREFYMMYRVSKNLYVPGVMIGGVLFYISCRHPAYFLEGIFISLFLLLFLRLISGKSPSGCMAEVGPLGVGFFYISGFLSFIWFLRTEIHGLQYIFLLFTSVWLADSAAYYIGTYLGKKKLCPSISPNKTFEGVYGSIGGGVLGALIIWAVFSLPGISFFTAAVIGAIIGIATVVGDLIESLFKRDAGVKDSSDLIPGHGGILDKLDGLLVAGPILYIILRYF